MEQKNGVSKTILDILPMIIGAGIIGMVGMQVTSLVKQTKQEGQIELLHTEVANIKELYGFTYTKSQAIADWKIQELKDTQQSERMNTIVTRQNNFDERLTELEKRPE